MVKCNKIIDLKKGFIEKLLLKLSSNRKDINANKIISFCENNLRCLENEEIEEYKTKQHFAGMKELFRGYAVNHWIRTSMYSKKHRCLNNIIAREHVRFYDRY